MMKWMTPVMLGSLLLAACAGRPAAPAAAAPFVPTAAQFERLFPARLPFYSYDGFVAAVRAMPGFASTGSDAVRRLEHPASRLGEDHAASEAGEERGPEPSFDIAELMAQGGLGEMQLARRLRHAAGAGDPGDEPQVPDLELHAGILAHERN